MRTEKTHAERFAAKMFGDPLSENGNFVMSPRSIADMLGLLACGACGETFESILNALSFGDGEEMRRAQSEAAEVIRAAAGPGAQCETDTALWVRKGLSLRPEFREEARKGFGATVAEIKMDESGRKAINDHVSQATRGMIPVLLSMAPEGDFVATNAVWFKGTWASMFDPEFTRKDVFHSPAGNVRVPFMWQTEWFPFAEGQDWEAARLLYEGGGFAFDVILPRPGVAVARTECLLDDILAESRAQFKEKDDSYLELALPKCDIDFSRNLKTPLTRMGAGRIFSPERADFTDIVDTEEPFWVNEIVHKARIQLDEEGTEAAAATAMPMAMGVPPPPRPFRVDRPFLFALRVVETGDILFCGRIENPAV